MPRTSSKRSPSKAGTKRRLVFDVDEEEPQEPSPSASHKRTAVRKTSTAVSAATSAPYGSPVAKRTKQTTLVVVTPDESKGAAAASKSKSKPAYVPTYIHKNVGYRRERDGLLSDVVLRAFDQIVAAHVIPDDLEQSRAYGPLSGACYQDRVLQAYTLGRLTVRKDFTGATCICTVCAETGHKRDACPTLI